MLNRAKLIKTFDDSIPQLYSAMQEEILHAQAYWQKFVSSSTQQEMVRGIPSIPTWQQLTTSTLQPTAGLYTAYSIDGSQIYPDRHQGFACYMINIGFVALHYGHTSAAYFDSIPFVHADESVYAHMSSERVNAQRTGYEFMLSKEWCLNYQSKTNLLFFDGSLIFWHLAMHEEELKNKLLEQYLGALQDLYMIQMPVIGYISLPKSKELVSILRELQKVQPQQPSCAFDYTVDADLLENWLQSGERTNLFEHKSALMQQYPEHVRIYFFYLNTGDEIARIELPAWLVDHVDAVASLVYDQVQKGLGYPICLAEAHEQAVIKGDDRDFFYRLMQEKTYSLNQNYKFSQKSLKKRMLGI